eukprot:gb/GFBE01025018.1/.p1 GENE.gb/GFBE01025018.1/~~gb/GFBE01025018.1/.p1  ORF type:complete len:723 (+),score=274.27 gb/GFBE01025018.1/:1-2169(+)
MKMLLRATVAAMVAVTASAADPKESSAVTKVITMLDDMHTKVDDELYQESRTYEKFETFCNETKAEKETSISELTDKKAELEATILAKSTRAKELGMDITGLEGDLTTVKEEIATLDDARKKEKAAYRDEKDRLDTAVKALDGAIDGLNTDSQAISFLQLPEGVQKAAALANFLGLKSTASQELLSAQESAQQGGAQLSGDFDLSFSLKGTLEKMLEDMRDARNTADLEEMKAQSAYSLTRQSKEQLAAEHKRHKAAAEAEKSQATKAKAAAEKSLELTETSLADDTAYLKELTKMAADKKAAWDLRKAAREGELEALAQASEIMKEGMKKETTKTADAVMVQVAEHHSALEEAEAAAEAAEAAEAAKVPAAASKNLRAGFLQLRSASQHRMQQPSARQQLAGMLRSKSVELQSPVLLAIARSAEDPSDPLAKVKDTISGLIADMESKAGEASDHKEFCDKNVAKQEEARDAASTEVTRLNIALASGEATRDQLAEEIDTLSTQLKELSTAKTEAETLRADEAAEAKKTVTEATEGKEAVEKALGVLTTYYDEAKAKQTKSKAKLPTAQNATGAAEDAPDAGFDDSKAYTGGGESSTVLGLLEVIKSDFNRTITDTTADEAKADSEHQEFLKDTTAAVTEKETAKGEKESEKVSTESQISTDVTSLESQASMLKGALNELAQLAKSCNAVGNSEMRIAKRAEEMDALKEAIDYLTKLMNGEV